MMAYSENPKDQEFQASNLKIKVLNLKKFIECILKLALNSSSEIILDYPVEKLAEATALKCLQFCGITDKKTALLSLEDVCRFIETSNVINIMSIAEEPEQTIDDNL